MKRIGLLVLFMALMWTGCYRHTFITDVTPAPEPTLESPFRVHVLYGVLSLEKDVKLDYLCPHGVARIETRQSFLNGVVRFFTNHLVTPRDLTVTCAAPPLSK